ncbi:hypothetical protein N8T08_005181 [Aspergillus melleus]|uniref:Uncharacterized protein n=1 Tax=Aspergillus melleus TaxID=138277 RepID=A0ACC3BGQ5_9EURO|nr:hypothetical protein N8T08_005181 [Aspergillus melleus]
MFPFITPSLFEHTIRAAYHQELSPTSPTAASARAQAIVGDLFTLELLIAAATRFVFHLEGNILPSHVDGPSSTLQRHTRTLFWLCYIMDHEYSLRSGLPPNFDDAHCDLSIPDCYGDCSTPSTCSPVFLPLIRLSIVQSEIYRRLYAVSALRQTDAQLLRTIRDLDELLENWKLSVPIDNRPTFTERPSDAGSMPSSIMQLQYHYCMATIHQASGRCSSWAQNQNTHGPGSSLAISVEASRSLLRKFSESELEFHRYNLLFCLPYFTAVMIHLFCNFLLHPLDPDCQADLDIMERVPHRIMAHMWPEAPLTFRMQVDFVKELSSELKRLAHSAVLNATDSDDGDNRDQENKAQRCWYFSPNYISQPATERTE